MWVVLLAVLASFLAAPGAAGAPSGLAVPKVDGKAAKEARSPKVDGRLLELAAEKDALRRQSLAAERRVELVGGAVRAVVELSREEEPAFLGGYGARIERARGRLVQALVPLEKLEALAGDSRVVLIRPPVELRPLDAGTGGIVSEGLERIGAAALQRAGVRGRGVKVAVIDLAFNGYRSNPELPAQAIAEVRSFRADGRVEDPADPSGAHGTACAEIVLDVAPEASLHLYAVGTELDIAAAVDWAVLRGVDVISMSLGTAAAPGDGTGFLCDVVNGARSRGVLFVVSAGNYGQGHYEGRFADADGDGWHEFAAGDEVLDLGYLEAGTPVELVLTWDDWPYSAQDYDLYLVGPGGVVAYSVNAQAGSFPPLECISCEAPYSGSYGVAVARYAATRPVRLELFSFYEDLAEYRVPEGSLTSPADAAGALAVGAVNWIDDSLKDYSSRGPTNDARTKPDLAAPAGVSTLSSRPLAFEGTSCAAPHVAGAAALLKSADPSLAAAGLQQELESLALDLGPPGRDNLYGAGSLRLAVPAQGPRVVSTSPRDGAVDVPVGGAITVTFSEDVQAGSAYESISVKDAAGNAVAAAKSLEGAALTLRPEGPLAYLTRYTVTIPAGAVKDLAGNLLAEDYAFSFTTAPGPGAVVAVGADPPDGATDVPVAKTVTVTFSVPVKPGPAYGKIVLLDERGRKASIRKKLAGTVLTVDPVKDLAYGTGYTLVLPANAVKAATGEGALEADFVLSFTTEPPDTTPPEVAGTDPADGGVLGSLRPTIKVYFSEPVYAGKNYAKVALYDPANKRVTVRKRIIEGQVLEVQPTKALKPGTNYRLHLPKGAVKDKAGNPLAGDVGVTLATPAS